MTIHSPMAKPLLTAPVRRIAHPTDLTAVSNNALAWATFLAKANAAELLLIHVVPPPVPIFEAESPLKAQAEHELAVLLTKLQMNAVNARAFVLCGTKSIDSQIIRAARLENIDLIIMGTRGRTGLSRLFIGSVASRVIARAHCPVLVVRGQSVRATSSQVTWYQHAENEKERELIP